MLRLTNDSIIKMLDTGIHQLGHKWSGIKWEVTVDGYDVLIIGTYTRVSDDKFPGSHRVARGWAKAGCTITLDAHTIAEQT